MSSLREKLDLKALPRHVAIIMDGNGRWAKKQGSLRIFGHRNALKAVRETLEGAVEIGLQYATLFTFSTENWNRPQAEVRALMQLLVSTIRQEMPTFMKNNIRVMAIGNLDDLPKRAHRQLLEAIEKTASNSGLTLTLALSYGGRWDLQNATRKIAMQVQKKLLDPIDINEDIIHQNLSTHFLPDPELIIRTSGEYRISNFLLWEMAYSEIFFCQKLWPDFTREDLFEALLDYQGRERRFGKISEQLKAI